MMNYEKFQEALAEEVRRKSEGRLQVRLDTLTKNNGVQADAMELREPENRYAPVLYLDSFYDQYLKGVGISHLASLALDCYEEFRKNPPVSADLVEDYRTAAPFLFCKIINYERNRRLLEEVPFERWLDLAVVCYFQMELPEEGNAAVLIRRSHLRMWGIEEELLWETAWKNTREKLKPLWQNLRDLLAGDERFEDDAPGEMSSIYLLTNVRKCLGAICIHYPGMTETVERCVKCDYYVLPSSVHECLILPAEGYSGGQLREMVEEINETRLPPQEVLSDQVYYYDRSLRRLMIQGEA